MIQCLEAAALFKAQHTIFSYPEKAAFNNKPGRSTFVVFSFSSSHGLTLTDAV